MFNYALIKNNKVVGLQSSTNAIDSPDLILLTKNQIVEINSNYDSATNTFTAHVIVAEKIRKISKGAFRRRLTLNEKVAIQTSADPIVKVLDEDLKASEFVDLDFQQFIDGLNYLASQNIFTVVRVTELLVDGTQAEQV